jgi:hypothetical protein
MSRRPRRRSPVAIVRAITRALAWRATAKINDRRHVDQQWVSKCVDMWSHHRLRRCRHVLERRRLVGFDDV